ncbi:TonB-dependent receptor [Flexithrix dorotheae]|uniref:TonB-dependent receptor n=1 Tax=Flexithrix dorotheae TaxID=70993 RepID=UPI00035FBB39|nr:TonB-dependent receptor [Flexithrix dorotheae]
MDKATYTFSLFFFCLGIFCQAQDNGLVYGVVKSIDGTLLPHSIIQIEEISRGGTTDINGAYALDNLPIGEYSIKVSFVGYHTISKIFNISNSIKEVRLNFVLTENTTTLEEINVERNLVEEKEIAGFAMEGISMKAIRNQSLEINTILDQTAGVRVRKAGGLGSRADYSVNGLGGKSIRFFIDGVPMDYFGSSYSVNTIPISLIDRIEIYKGIVPIELSNDALGGAINLITKKSYDNAVELSYSFGSFNTHRASLLANYRNKDSGATVRLSAFYNYSDNDYQIWGDDVYATDPETYTVQRGIKVRRFHDAFASKAVKTDIGFTNKKFADQFFLGLLYSDLDKELQHGSTMEVPYGEATYSQNVIVPYLVYQKHDLIKGFDLNLFSSLSQLSRSQVDTSRNIYNWYGEIEGTRTLGGERVRTLNELNERVFLNRVNLVYRINEQHQIGFNSIVSLLNRTENDPLITQKNDGYWSPQKFKKTSMGLLFQSEMLQKKLNTSVFLKAFHFNADIKTSEIIQGVPNYFTEYTSSGSLGFGFAGSYQLTSHLRITTSFEKANRLPEANEVLGDGLMVSSTSSLRPETSYNANLGFNLQLFAAQENRLKLSANAFYRDVFDLIQQWQYDLGAFVYINFDEVRMSGLDAKLEYWYKSKFSLTQTFSHLNPIIKSDFDELGNNNITQGSRLPNTPFLQLNTNARLNFKNLFQANSKIFIYWTIAYVGAFHRYPEIIGEFNKDIIPAQLVNDCGFGYTFPNQKLSLSLDFNNIFNEQVFDNYAIQNAGRSAYFKITYKII